MLGHHPVHEHPAEHLIEVFRAEQADRRIVDGEQEPVEADPHQAGRLPVEQTSEIRGVVDG